MVTCQLHRRPMSNLQIQMIHQNPEDLDGHSVTQKFDVSSPQLVTQGTKVKYQQKALIQRVARPQDLVGLDFRLELHHGGQINRTQSERREQHLNGSRCNSVSKKSIIQSLRVTREAIANLIRRACSRHPGRNNADNFRATGGVSICKAVSALCSGHQRCSKRNNELLAICHIL